MRNSAGTAAGSTTRNFHTLRRVMRPTAGSELGTFTLGVSTGAFSIAVASFSRPAARAASASRSRLPDAGALFLLRLLAPLAVDALLLHAVVRDLLLQVGLGACSGTDRLLLGIEEHALGGVLRLLQRGEELLHPRRRSFTCLPRSTASE
jgi:hypothetical protein